MTEYILFDYGGVIADHYCEPATSLLTELLGTSRGELMELISERSEAGRDFRLSRVNREEFWDIVRKVVSNKQFSADKAQELWAESYIPNQAMLNLISYLRSTYGVRTAILMNEDVDRFEYIQNLTKWSNYVDFFVSSHETGFLKPHAGSYLSAAERWQVNPSEILYVDDRKSHVEAAQAIGMKGHIFQNYGELWKSLLKERELIPYRAKPLTVECDVTYPNTKQVEIKPGIQL